MIKIIGLILEGKTPPDTRVAFTPEQCKLIQDKYKIKVLVQRSDIRVFKDIEYKNAGVEVVDDLHACNVILGIKEVPIPMLIDGKTYMFFSHTLKKQAYNRKLLQAILKKNIRLIDYEALKDTDGLRLAGFGRYAGIVGAYNAFRGWGKMIGKFSLTPANQCFDQKELEAELPKVILPKYFKIVVTGDGRVAGGVLEILRAKKIRQVTPKEFLLQSFEEPVFTQLTVDLYNKSLDGQPFDKSAFYKKPELFTSNFERFSRVADMLITAHFWASKAPHIYTAEMAASPQNNIKFVADVSCDPAGPIAPTLRASTIAQPFYGYNVHSRQEVPLGSAGSIGVMAIDNLPTELPRDASEGFGRELLTNVLPALLGDDPDDIIGRATETENGQLTTHFAYLQDYVDA